jgi:calcineurin-like phosphoesterase family protein
MLPEVFVGAGDIAVCGSRGTEATAMLLDAIGGTVFTAGDNAYPAGTAQQYLDCYDPTWGRQRGRTRPTPGNHEYVASPVAASYFEYFGAAAGPPGLGYYSFELGAWHAISLNSNIGVGQRSAQGQWLQADLASNQTKCSLAYWHHPRFTSGPNGDNAEMVEFWRLLYAAGVEIVVNGHDHLYERFAPQDPDGFPDPARGIRQFTVGTGGAPLYDVAALKANSEAVVRSFGVLRLTLEQNSYSWEFIAVSGRGDSGVGSCH